MKNMNDSLTSSSVLIISEDPELVNSLIKNNNTDKEFRTLKSIQQVLEKPEILERNSLVILDVGNNGNDINTAKNQILKIKQQDPTQVLILTGGSEVLGNMLKSNIQPLIYRAFTKPVSPSQVFLAFKSGHQQHQDLLQRQSEGIDITPVGPGENRTNVTSLANESKSKTALFVGLGVGLIAIAIAAWFLFNDAALRPEVTTSETVDVPNMDTSNPTKAARTTNFTGRAQEIDRLSQFAEKALFDERFIVPIGDNALDYYQQVLALDAYNTGAYQGKMAIADGLRESYNQLLKNAEFDKALNVISVLHRIEPLDIQNDRLRGDLEKAVELHVRQVRASGSAEDIARITALIGKLGSQFSRTNTASNALKKEKAMLVEIDKALESNNLAPPQPGNAYSIVSEALKANSISKANISPRVASLSQKLLSQVTVGFDANPIAEIEKLIALIEQLKVNPKGLVKLKRQLADRQAAKLATTELEMKTAPEVTKIIPAKVISQPTPKYPTMALNRHAEGWVEVTFDIDISGVPIEVEIINSKPQNLFDAAALRSVKNWRFSPARDEATGLPVQSTIKSTKVHFKLEE